MLDKLPPAMFLADSRGLDFLNSLAVPVDVEVEWLASGEDLLAWLEAAELVSPQVIEEIRSAARPGELDAVAKQARELREWFREFVRHHRGKPLTRKAVAELEPLNQLLARDQEFKQIAPRAKADTEHGDGALQLIQQRRWQSADALLLPLAQAIAQLLTTADFTDVKACEGPVCTLHFLDTTRGRRRRWCSMAVCGNRAKQAAHRHRVGSQ